MPIRSQRLLYAITVLLASLVAGCKEQSSPSQTLSSPSPATASAPATNNVNAVPAANATASSSDKRPIDACKLLTGEEIKSIQSDTLKDATLSPTGSDAFITSQCFYATTNFVNSVSLKVSQQSSNSGAENIREFWKERFGSAGSNEKEREKEREKKSERERERDRDKKAKATEEEEEERTPPERVNGIGDEAYAVGNAKMGALYVLKGDKFLRISIGGSHSQPERIKKMKTLAQYVIKRF